MDLHTLGYVTLVDTGLSRIETIKNLIDFYRKQGYSFDLKWWKDFVDNPGNEIPCIISYGCFLDLQHYLTGIAVVKFTSVNSIDHLISDVEFELKTKVVPGTEITKEHFGRTIFIPRAFGKTVFCNRVGDFGTIITIAKRATREEHYISVNTNGVTAEFIPIVNDFIFLEENCGIC